MNFISYLTSSSSYKKTIATVTANRQTDLLVVTLFKIKNGGLIASIFYSLTHQLILRLQLMNIILQSLHNFVVTELR